VQVGSFAAAPSPVAAGNPVTLTADRVTTATSGATVTKVAFYYVDSTTGFQQFLGYGTRNADGTWTLTFTMTLAPRSYKLLALAADSTGAVSDPFAINLDVM
jgi:hypothetical protein